MLKSSRFLSIFSRASRHFLKTPSCFCVRPLSRAYFSDQVPDSEPSFTKTSTENLEFKAETKRLLDIVAKSLYQDKEVFLRELLSNSADALEKQRYMQLSGKDVSPGEPLQISVILSESKKQIVIQDTGIGSSSIKLFLNFT